MPRGTEPRVGSAVPRGAEPRVGSAVPRGAEPRAGSAEPRCAASPTERAASRTERAAPPTERAAAPVAGVEAVAAPGGARAVVFDGAGEPLRIARVAVPAPGPGEVVVRVRATTICGSDVSTFTGRRPGPTPGVLGHEAVGTVEAVGAGARDLDGAPLAPGARVTWSILTTCGACERCARGISQKCERLVKFGHERLGSVPGPAGGLAERVLLQRGTAIVVLPDTVGDAVACPAACATATVAAVLRVGAVGPGDRVLVVGLGMLGLTACAMATSRGALVSATDLDPGRRALATAFGATTEVPADCDVVLELSGSPEATATALATLAIGGRAVLAGAVHPAARVALDAELVVRRLLRIEGVHNYGPQDLREAVRFLAAEGRRYPFAELVAGPYELDDAAAAFAAAQTGALRVMVRP